MGRCIGPRTCVLLDVSTFGTGSLSLSRMLSIVFDFIEISFIFHFFRFFPKLFVCVFLSFQATLRTHSNTDSTRMINVREWLTNVEQWERIADQSVASHDFSWCQPLAAAAARWGLQPNIEERKQSNGSRR